MDTILGHARVLVYSLISLMPSPYQKASFEAMMGLFLSESGHALPQQTSVKSPSSLRSAVYMWWFWATLSLAPLTCSKRFINSHDAVWWVSVTLVS
jgi:hypothetical protein